MDQTLIDSEVTLREKNERANSATVFESGEQTLREGALAAGSSLAARVTFRDCTILEQLPTRGAEADIYLVEAEGERSILKLYRHRLEPKLEVLTRVAEISRLHSRCFVVFKDTGFDEQTGRWFELQEYVPLGSLKEVPPDKKQQPSFVKKLVSELSDAIHCLHDNEIIHCDIKPGNVLIRSLEPLDAVLTDFGISSLLASDLSRKMTNLKGTPMYWAPEAFSRMVGRPCDWWGLGMIALELLVGAHPLEGLSDSQIIHKLTLGNVEIPNTLDGDFALLLRGLLTKDDMKRWGRHEVSRWLAGDRDIPVHYERPAVETAPSSRSSTPAFPFEGREYHTPEELARVFCENEKPWNAATSYLRYTRQWFESLMLFDEAVEIGTWLGSMQSDRALFRFIHTYARCPFSYKGKLIDIDNLRLFLGRTAKLEGGESEGQISAMMGDGRLLAFYDEYAKLTGNQDPLLKNVLLLMNGKLPADQWIYFEALYAPKEYLLPDDCEPQRLEEDKNKTAEALLALRTPPFKGRSIEDLKRQYVLPLCLLNLLKDTRTYAEGAEGLRSLQRQGLLIPRTSDGLEAFNAALPYEEYLQNARSICMGHTPALIAKLDGLLLDLDALPTSRNALNNTAFSQALFYFGGLKSRKIDALDALAIGRLSSLFEARRQNRRKLPIMLPISGTVGALLLWALATLGRSGVFPVLRVIFAGGLFLAGAYLVFRTNFLWIADESQNGGSSRRRLSSLDPRFLPFAALLMSSFALFDHLSAFFPTALVLFMGGALGSGGYFAFNFYFMHLNYRKTAEVCAESVRKFFL